MSGKGPLADISALLYVAPFAISGVYAIYLWAQVGISAVLPTTAYLGVTRDPIVFIIGTSAVLLGVVLDQMSFDASARAGQVPSLAKRLQSMAIASLVLALICAVYANVGAKPWVDFSGAADDFIVGRYALVFPVMLFMMSYFVSSKVSLTSLTSPRSLGMAAILAVPVLVYELGRRSAITGLGLGFAFLVVGLVILMRKPKPAAPAGKPA